MQSEILGPGSLGLPLPNNRFIFVNQFFIFQKKTIIITKFIY